jgi:hypothetical protein
VSLTQLIVLQAQRLPVYFVKDRQCYFQLFLAVRKILDPWICAFLLDHELVLINVKAHLVLIYKVLLLLELLLVLHPLDKFLADVLYSIFVVAEHHTEYAHRINMLNSRLTLLPVLFSRFLEETAKAAFDLS